MIPTDWTPVHRDDGERVGWLAPDGDSGRVHPLLLTGTPLSRARSVPEAAALLRADGLRALDRRWWARLPDVLSGVVPVEQPEPDWDWQPVVLVEVSPLEAVVRHEFAVTPGRGRLPVPVGDLLRPEPPP